MAAILEKVLAKEIEADEVVQWLLKPNITDEESQGSLDELGAVKEDVIPFLLNFLRDQTLHLIQGCRSTTTTPAKTPSSLLKVKKKTSTPASDGHKGKRVQLFGSNKKDSSPSDNHHNNSDDWGRDGRKQLNRSNNSGDSRQHARSGKSSHNHSSPTDHPRHQRSKQSLADFLSAPNNSGNQEESPRSRRRSGGKKTHSAEKRKPNNSRTNDNSQNTPPVFSNDDFPPVGTPSPAVGNKTSPLVPVGAQIITSSRRVVTTLLSPNQSNNTSDNSVFKLAKELSQPQPRGAWLSPIDSRNIPRTLPVSLVSPPPGMVLSSIPEIGRSPNSPWSRPLVDKNTSKAIRRVELNSVSPSAADESFDSPIFKRVLEKEPKLQESLAQKYSTPKKSVTINPIEQVTPVKSCTTPGKDICTPTKSLIERLASIEIQQANPISVTHADELQTIAGLYSGCITENLVPNLTVEMYFLTQLLTARGSENEFPIDLSQDLDEVQYFGSIHNAVYFAVTVLSKQKRLLSLLDRGTIRLVADNQRVSEFSDTLKDQLIIHLDNSSVKAPATMSYPSPVGGISFQAETDNKKNFPNEKSFHMFKKQRDTFYELLREWEESHLSPGWSVIDAQGERIRRLISFRTDLANHVHFSRLFLSQLLQMCKGDQSSLTGDDDTSISLLSQLRLTNPDKLKRLQERFTTPSSMGGPCPPASFPGCQEFFRDFVMAASSHVFNQHLSDSMASKIADLNETPFTNLGADIDEEEEVIVDAEDHEALLSCLLNLKLLGKFLGFVTFLPYQSPENLPESFTNSFISMRNQTSPVIDILLYMKQAQLEGRVIVTIPWVIDFLSMADPMASQLDYYQVVFILLIKIYRETGELFTHTGSHTQLLLIAMLGWFFDLAIFPAELFFKEHKAIEKGAVLKTLPKNCVDLMNIVDQQILYACCPYIGEVRNLLMDFAVGMSSRNNNIRKITPVSTKPLTTSSVTEKQLQHQLEDNFFHNHPASMKRTVEFVADRVASNQIKQFRARAFPGLLEEGYRRAREVARSAQSPDTRAKKKLAEQVEQLAAEMSRKSKSTSMSTALGYCDAKTSAILPLMLPEEISSQVLTMSSQISVRVAMEKINNWLTTHITTAMFKRELLSEFEKTFKSSTSQDKLVIKTQSSSTHALTTHNDTTPSPSDTVVMFKDLLKELIIGESSLEVAHVREVLSKVANVIETRQDLLPPVCKCLAKMTVDLTYLMVLDHPTLWTEEISDALSRLWSGHLKCYTSFHHIISHKNISLLCSPDHQQLKLEKYKELISLVLKLGLTSLVHVTRGCCSMSHGTTNKDVQALLVSLFHEASAVPADIELTEEELTEIQEFLDSLDSICDDQSEREILESIRTNINSSNRMIQDDPSKTDEKTAEFGTT